MHFNHIVLFRHLCNIFIDPMLLFWKYLLEFVLMSPFSEQFCKLTGPKLVCSSNKNLEFFSLYDLQMLLVDEYFLFSHEKHSTMALFFYIGHESYADHDVVWKMWIIWPFEWAHIDAVWRRYDILKLGIENHIGQTCISKPDEKLITDLKPQVCNLMFVNLEVR